MEGHVSPKLENACLAAYDRACARVQRKRYHRERDDLLQEIYIDYRRKVLDRDENALPGVFVGWEEVDVERLSNLMVGRYNSRIVNVLRADGRCSPGVDRRPGRGGEPLALGDRDPVTGLPALFPSRYGRVPLRPGHRPDSPQEALFDDLDECAEQVARVERARELAGEVCEEASERHELGGDVLFLRLGEGLGPREIGERLGISEGYAKKILHLAKLDLEDAHGVSLTTQVPGPPRKRRRCKQADGQEPRPESVE